MSDRFQGRILVLGAGSVAQCVIPLLLEHLVDAKQMTIVDQRDNRSRVKSAIDAGATYIQDTVTKENLDSFLSSHLSAGDFLLDLAWNIDANTILGWAHDHDVMYLNTSIEEWDPYEGGNNKHPLERTLYVRHMRMREMKSKWDKPGATAIVEHGANPGLVSHLVKKALVDIANKTIEDGIATDAIKSALAAEDYAKLAQALTVKVIHISERDTQVTDVPKRPGEFVNTWSVAGFHEEGIAPAELGWGTHEQKLPPKGLRHETSETQICIANPGATTWVRSWVPDYEINGMVVRHGEAYTITKHLTVKDDSGKEIYRPTVHYAYCPSDAAIASMRELQANNWEFPTKERIMNDEIIDGEDRLGVLLMGHPLNAWWTGSLLSIHEARKLAPHQSATTLQVASSVLACTKWMIENPNKGLCVPDDLPWDEVLETAYPYLGPIHSAAVDWTPLKNRVDLFGKWDGQTKSSDPWQFENFLIS